MSNNQAYAQEKQTAIEAVTLAAMLCRQVRADMVSPEALQKGDKSPVTVADFGAQALVCHKLKTVFSNDVIVGEEDSADLRKSENLAILRQITQYVRQFHPAANAETVCEWIDAGNGAVAQRFWTLDPIDGTKGFLRNNQYAIALALIEDGEVRVGALACPALPLDLNQADSPGGVVFVAARGQGAAMASLGGPSNNFQPIRVAAEAAPDALRFVESVEAGHGNHALQEAAARAAGITQPSLRMDSQVKYGVIARGDAALYLRLPSPKSPDYRENIWDHAAGSLIVEEAGGRVSDMRANPLDFASNYKMRHNQGVVVSNGALHTAVIKALAQM